MAAHVALVAVATVVYMTVPATRTPLWAVIGLAGAAAVVAGVRLNRPAHPWPWWVLAAGLVTFVSGDTYDNVMEEYFHASNPFPSPADACYLATYPLFATGLSGLVRYRWAGRDLPSLLDALIFTAALALPVWVCLMQPLTEVDGLTWQQRAISIAYPLGDVLVLALLARLLTPHPVHGGGGRSVRLLVVGTVTLLGFDIAHGLLQLNGLWQTSTHTDSGWIIFYTAWGLAALHPSMVRLTAAVPHRGSLLPPRRRLVLLAAATLIAPAVLLDEGLRGTAHDAPVIAVFSALLFLLVILRLAGMVVAHHRAVARELALRRAAVSLVSAVRREEVAGSCEAAVDTLLGPTVRHRTLLLSAEHAAPRDPNRTRLLPYADLDPDIAARLGGDLAGMPAVLVSPMTPPVSGELPGVLLVAAAARRLTETWRSLDILAFQAGLAMEAQVIQTLSRPFALGEQTVTGRPHHPVRQSVRGAVSASVGVATARDSTDEEELLRHADLALYAAKSAGKRQWRRFRPMLQSRMVRGHDLQSRLAQAVAGEEFALRYQPVVDITAGDVVGFEALVRWPRFPLRSRSRAGRAAKR
ncbi:EAL domain-containing protein [Streptomyces sp. JB150]|nr:EAL domain-containing protein [Streptomyces sp. JB150]